ncbi:prepilin peptidase [Naasia lichenicola]|uniref:Prepilin leader peptidase/N-methyltransferase n=1 Tax=Naasia lichenicola TaxID=2565933 RepID=A0A4S4FIG5_9MICO|nr:A24 family peptidase [Naasia lichenicola]THG29654.1 prepilin peptidase [Naasia lichenicola]
MLAIVDSGLLRILPAIIGAFGLAFGSFLNVVVYRVPRGLSVVNPPSACPGCSSEISARDNIPVVSWLLLRGRCRTCREPISARYPIVEAITAVAFVVVGIFFAARIGTQTTAVGAVGAGITMIAFLYLAAISVALTAIDLDLRRLPTAIVYPAYGVGALLLGISGLLSGDLVSLAWAAAGAGLSFAFFLILLVVSGGGMGWGDVKLAGVLGLFLGFLGPAPLFVGVAAGFLLGGLYGIGMLLAGRGGRKTAIPFGPFMIAGAWLAVFVGQPVADAYLSVTGLN